MTATIPDQMRCGIRQSQTVDATTGEWRPTAFRLEGDAMATNRKPAPTQAATPAAELVRRSPASPPAERPARGTPATHQDGWARPRRPATKMAPGTAATSARGWRRMSDALRRQIR